MQGVSEVPIAIMKDQVESGAVRDHDKPVRKRRHPNDENANTKERNVLSVKPGRGPSAMSAIGGIFGVVFGIFWTVGVFVMTKDAPFPLVHIFFPLFGVLFIVIGIANVFYSLANTVSPDRMSVVDITTGEEESDPLQRIILGEDSRAHEHAQSETESIEERLAKLETLLQEHAITDAEYLEQRKRILEEI